MRLLSEYSDVTVGGARDVRQQARLAARGGILLAEDLMDIKTLQEFLEQRSSSNVSPDTF